MPKLQSAYAMRSNSSTFIIIKDCRRIQKRRLCDQDNLADITGEECIPNLLQGQSANCSFIECTNPSEIKSIRGNLIVLKKVESMELNSTCGLNSRNLTGSYLIEYHNCSIYLNGSTFQNNEFIQVEPPIVLPLDGLRITESHFEPVLRLEEVSITNRKFLEDLTKSHQVKTYSSFTMSTLSFLTVLTAAAIIAWKTIFRKHNPVSKLLQSDMDKKEHKPNESRAYTNRDDSLSKGGVDNDRSTPRTQELVLQIHRIQQSQQDVAARLNAIPQTEDLHQTRCQQQQQQQH